MIRNQISPDFRFPEVGMYTVKAWPYFQEEHIKHLLSPYKSWHSFIVCYLSNLILFNVNVQRIPGFIIAKQLPSCGHFGQSGIT